MGPRAEQSALAAPAVSEKTPLLGDAPVAVLLPLPLAEPEPSPADALSAKQLADFVADPFWRALRTAFFFGYWILLLVLLAAALSLSFSRCRSPHAAAGLLPATPSAPSLPASLHESLPASLHQSLHESLHASLAPKPA